MWMGVTGNSVDERQRSRTKANSNTTLYRIRPSKNRLQPFWRLLLSRYVPYCTYERLNRSDWCHHVRTLHIRSRDITSNRKIRFHWTISLIVWYHILWYHITLHRTTWRHATSCNWIGQDYELQSHQCYPQCRSRFNLDFSARMGGPGPQAC